MEEKENGNGYDSSSIQVLEGLSAVRKRPGMYIGSTSSRGLHHLVYEVVDNSVDEALAGYCDTITVTIHKDNSITVVDNGRGIPTDIMPEYGLSALQIVLTKLHAGGKFSKSSYKVSGGLHGVGVSVVNALSEDFIATVWREGTEYVQRFSRGDAVGELTKKSIDNNKMGTMIWFKPDSIIFTETEYDYDILSARLRELAFLNSGLRIILDDDRTQRKEEYMYEGGIQKFVEYINEGKQPLHDTIRIMTEQEDIIADIALQYNHSYSENIHSFVNNINTMEGGTHLTGFKSAITRALNNYLQKNMAKEAKNGQLSGNDVREGLTAVISIKIAEPQFEGQTKTKLGNSEVKGAVDKITFNKLSQIFDEQPQIAKRIIEKCLQSARAREAAAKARDLVRRKSVLESSTLPGKLADCSTKNKQKAEIYIVEGDSAGGCFSGDTLIALLDGRNISFKQIIEEQNRGIQHYCYTIRDGRISVGEIKHPRMTKKNARVIKLILDNDQEIICTPDHMFMLRSGEYKKASSLTPNDSLMPLYKQKSRLGKRITIEDYEMVYDNSELRWIFTHLISDEYNISTGIYDITKGAQRHHINFNKHNNNPTNITRLSREEHMRLHSEHAKRTLHTVESKRKSRNTRSTQQYREKMRKKMLEQSEIISRRSTEQWKDEHYKIFMRNAFLKYYYGNEAYRIKNNALLNRVQKEYWSNEGNRKKQSIITKEYFKSNSRARKRLSVMAKKQWENKELLEWRKEKTKQQWTQEFRQKRMQSYNETYKRETLSLMRAIYEATGSISVNSFETARKNIQNSTILKYDTFIDRFFEGNETDMKRAILNYNHKIVRIIDENKRMDVYDIEVPGTHNFALASGIFVHNSAKQARDREFQAILPLRGKILNVEKSHLSKAIKNKEIQSLITAIGTSIGEDFNIEKIRYGKIIVMTDADVDGAHIRTLLLTFFFRYMRELIEAGYVYIAQPPLYKVQKGRKSYYAHTDEELKHILSNEGMENSGIQRYKGLGEMNPQQLWETTMDPKERSLLQVTIEDAMLADKLFTTLMGMEVEPRRAFIETHALEVQNLDL
ncbi:MAG: DNA topoisomerase (ATP-hydrolyzing) subunit B [Candidatus Woesearchaeota archaeon]